MPYGVYWEYNFDYEETVASFLFVPEYMKKNARGDLNSVGATIMYRTVSQSTPKKTYRYHRAQPCNAGLIGSYGDPSTLAVQMMPQLGIFNEPVIQSVDGNPDFKLTREPIFIEISETELEGIQDEVTPRSLTARLYRARAAAGYPALPGKEDDE